MANFKVYPPIAAQPQSVPLTVPANQTISADFDQFTAPSGFGVPAMYIRISATGSAFGAGNTPQIGLAVDGQATPTFLNNQFQQLGTVGSAFMNKVVGLTNVLEAVMTFDNDPPGNHTWKIFIQNVQPQNGNEARDFVWVVGATEADATQPWIDVDPALTFPRELVNGNPSSSNVSVRNFGTGPFDVTGLAGAAAVFSLGNTPNVPPQGSTPLVVTFTPGNTSGQFNSTATLTTNPVDTVATTLAKHNQQLQLSAGTGQLEVALLLDTSGSMAWDACGNNPATPSKARWSELASAVQQFMPALAHFGQSKGKVGVARFPGSNPANPTDDLTNFDICLPMAIPDKNDGTLLNLINNVIPNIPPVDSTPMGNGIYRVLNPIDASHPGYFSSDAASLAANWRWLLLMTDGAHNAGQHAPQEFICKAFGGAVPGGSQTALEQQKIMLYAAGYGVGKASNVDHKVLQNLVASSLPGGQTIDVDGTLDATATCPPANTPQQNIVSAQQLSDSFMTAIKAQIPGLNAPADPAATFYSDQTEARHVVRVTSYDGRAAFRLAWNTPDAERLSLALLTPTCESINGGNWQTFQGVTFVSGARHQMFLIDPEFVRGTTQAGDNRFGNWTMVVSRPVEIPVIRAAARTLYENYSYDMMIESQLRMALSVDQSIYYAGDAITVTAQLTADGFPITHALVSLSTTAPDLAVDNWLAGLKVTDDALKRAQDLLRGKDSTPLLVKSVAAGLMGLSYPGQSKHGSIPMTDTAGNGIYRATLTDTATPEAYTLYVTAIGVTPDGMEFRREGQIRTQVLVRPEPAFTFLGMHYPQAGLVNLTATPRDRFGNVLLLNPEVTPSFGFVASGGQFTGPLVSNLDGTYSRSLQYGAGQPPAISFVWGDVTVVPPQHVVPTTGLRYVDHVVRFVLGGEAAPNANQHRDPQAALGDVFQKPAGEFVSLGAAGVLTTRVNNMLILPAADNDVTVFVQPDADLRAYRVDAYAPPHPVFGEGGVNVKVGLMEFDANAPAHDIPITLQPAIPGFDYSTLWAALQRRVGEGWQNVWASGHAGDLQWPVNRDKNLQQGRYRWVFFQSKPDEHARPVAFTFDFALPQPGKVITLIQIDMTELANYLGAWGVPPDDDKHWVHLGDSDGSTDSFGLANAGAKLATAIRVTDLSRRTRGPDFKPSATPGVSIRGIGIIKAGPLTSQP